MGFLGTTKKCVGACGATSWKAMHFWGEEEKTESFHEHVTLADAQNIKNICGSISWSASLDTKLSYLNPTWWCLYRIYKFVRKDLDLSAADNLCTLM